MFFLIGCSRYALWSAERLETAGRLPEAAVTYRDFALAHPKDARSAESLLHAAVLFGPKLGKCDLARPLYERVARDYGDPFAAQAKLGLLECPDYFPLKPGARWVLVDPQTGGKNMRQDVGATVIGDGKAELETKLYAGKKLFSTSRRTYAKGDWRVVEADPKTKESATILRYPFQVGAEWSEDHRGHSVTYTIESDSATAKTRGGVFMSCLKVKEQVEGLPGWKADYYCPGVGRVLTTAGSDRSETPTAELLTATMP